MKHKTPLLLRHKTWFIGLFQAALVSCSLIVAWLLRFDFSLPYRRIILLGLPALLLVRIATMAYFGLFRGWWRYAGVRDGVDVLKAVGTGSLLFWVTMRFAFKATGFPRSIYVLEALLTAGLLVGVRLLSRALAESVQEDLSSNKRVILIGAGAAAQTILREICRPGSGYVALGCLDDDRSKLGIRIHDVPVVGTVDDLASLVSSETADEVLIAVPSATETQMNRFVSICNKAKVKFRSHFSKHQFTQPQLLSFLCLMRYEDWTFRETEVRLGEHRKLRQTLGLVSVPDFTTLYRFLKRLDDETIDRAVGETVRRLPGSRHWGRKRAHVAVDTTGLPQEAVSTSFVRRMHHHG